MKIRIVLQDKSIDGIECPYPVVWLRVRDRYGTWTKLDFRVDTQADFTCIPAARARREHLPFSEARPHAAGGLVGTTTAYRGRVRLSLAGREHDWPCDFVNVPASRPAGGATSAVLGRAGFLDEYAISVDSGYLIITRLGPLRRLLRRWLHAWWKWSGREHPPELPL